MFPEIASRGITTIIHLGDLVDRRKFINFNTLSAMNQSFVAKLAPYDVHIIAGNHDVFYKSTNQLNSLDLLLKSNDNITVHTETTTVNIYGIPLLFVPWINQQNIDISLQTINHSTSQLCFGHLELVGFEMFKGSMCDHGLSPSVFDRFDMVFSGHFHHKSSKGNIHYLGAPYQMTWADYGFDRGFHVFDLNTRELEFIKNPFQPFVRLAYNDTSKTTEQLIEWANRLDVEDVFCKLDVLNKTNPYAFDLIVDIIESKRPYDLKINEVVDAENFTPVANCSYKDTQTLIINAVDQLELTTDKSELKRLLTQLYYEALDIEINN